MQVSRNIFFQSSLENVCSQSTFKTKKENQNISGNNSVDELDSFDSKSKIKYLTSIHYIIEKNENEYLEKSRALWFFDRLFNSKKFKEVKFLCENLQKQISEYNRLYSKCKKDVETTRTSNVNFEICFSVENQGKREAERNNYSEAFDYYEKAKNFYGQFGFTDEQEEMRQCCVQCSQQAAEMNMQRGKTDGSALEKLECYEKAIKQFKIAGNKKGEEGATKEYIKIALTCGENAAKTGCRQEAYHLYEKAAAYDSKDAAYSLFQLYLTSVNIEDEHKAMHWYLQAQQLKHPEASKLMDIEQMRQYKKKMNHFTSLFTPISIRENDYLRVEFYHSCVKIAEYLKMKNFDQYFCQLFSNYSKKKERQRICHTLLAIGKKLSTATIENQSPISDQVVTGRGNGALIYDFMIQLNGIYIKESENEKGNGSSKHVVAAKCLNALEIPYVWKETLQINRQVLSTEQGHLQALANASIPNIEPPYKGYATNPITNQICLIQEQCEQMENLVKEDGKIDEKLCILRDVAIALAALHKSGFLHLDVKVKNILYKQSGEKTTGLLSDFGELVTTRGTRTEKRGDVDQTSAVTSFTCTQLYAPSETQPTPAFDSFSLGAAIFETVTKQQVHFGGYNNQWDIDAVIGVEKDKRGKTKDRREFEMLSIANALLKVNPNQRMTSERASICLEKVRKLGT